MAFTGEWLLRIGQSLIAKNLLLDACKKQNIECFVILSNVMQKLAMVMKRNPKSFQTNSSKFTL